MTDKITAVIEILEDLVMSKQSGNDYSRDLLDLLPEAPE